MPRNPTTGVYTAPDNSWNPAVAGTVIDPDDWNTQLTDYEAALTDSLSRSGDGGMEADFYFQDLPTVSLGLGPTTPTAGSAMAVDWMWGTDAEKTLLINEAGIWAGKVFTGFGCSKSFDSSNDSVSADLGPNVGLFSLASNDGTNNDVVAVLGSANARENDTTVFGGNFIARTEPGLTGVKLVGFEIDVEPASGVTPAAGSAGLYINVFNSACPGAALQVGSISSGTFANGIVLGGMASTGAGLSPNAGTTMGSLINSGIATYNHDAIILNNTHKLRLAGTASTHAKLYNDGSNNIRLVYGSGGFALRNSADTVSLAFFSSSGTATIGEAGSAQGALAISGVTSGAVTLAVQAAAGTYNFNLPTTAGSSGQVLTSAAGGSSPMTWTTLATVATSGSASDLGTGTLPTGRLSGSYTGITTVGTLTGLSISATTGQFNVISSTGNSQFSLYDTVDGGWTFFSQDGTFRVASINTAGSFVANAWSVASNGVANFSNSTATPAGGSTAARLLLGTTAGFGIYYGSGAPSVSAAQGSIYLRSDGSGTGNRFYINNSSGSGTTWTAVTTAA